MKSEHARKIRSAFEYVRNQLSAKSRMDEYDLLLRACANEGYCTFTFEDLVAHLSANTPFPARMIVLRHDVDWSVEAARVMFETERRARAKSSYFFRLSTAEERLMNTMAEAGYEVGYHYEEITTFAKTYGLANIEQVGKAMPWIRDAFCENLGRLRRSTGLPIKVVASHGDFVNRMIGMANLMLLSPEVRRDMGIVAEAYDAAIMKPISYRCIDDLPPTLWRSYSPYSGDPRNGVAQHTPYMYAVIHPNNWHPKLPTTARYLLTRASEGVLYWAIDLARRVPGLSERNLPPSEHASARWIIMSSKTEHPLDLRDSTISHAGSRQAMRHAVTLEPQSPSSAPVSDWSQETSVVAFAEKRPEHGTAPSSVDIEKLLSDIDARRCQVGVIGLGYVGLPLALACCSAGFRVVGFDVDEKKVQTIADGVSPIRHVGNGQMSAAVRAGKLSTTADFSRLAEPDVLILCVPTPLGQHYEPDLSFIEKTGQSVARALRKGQLVVLESTTYPGTTAEVLKPILERNGLRSGKDFFLAYSPEREDPGNPDYRTTRIPKVVAGDDEIARELACRLYGHVIVRTVPVSSLETAEAVKLTENIFRSVNIALVNELKLIFAKMGIDIFEVIDAAKTKPFGFMPFYPGPGLGGHCIPIDPFYLTWKAREFDQPTRFIELAGEINSSMPHYVIGRVREALDVHAGKGLKDARVLILGLAYKRDVDDMRESPSLKLMKMLADACAQVDYFDPYFPSIPPSREYAVFTGKRGVDLNGDTVRSYDAVVLVTDHSDLDYAMVAREARIVIDTRNKFKAANGCNAIIVKS